MKPATPKTEPPQSTQLRKAVFGGSLMKRVTILLGMYALSVVVHAQLRESDGKGGWVAPDKRVSFAEGYGERMGIKQTVNGQPKTCPLAFQDVAYVSEKDGSKTNRLTVSAYRGLAFAVPHELAVAKYKKMRAEIVIEIESVEKGIFIPKNTCPVPLVQTADGFDPNCQTFQNITWRFATNMTFVTISTNITAYVVQKPGATIRFTEDGVKLQDVQEKPGLKEVEKLLETHKNTKQ
jgi:hypothetical protein